MKIFLLCLKMTNSGLKIVTLSNLSFLSYLVNVFSKTFVNVFLTLQYKQNPWKHLVTPKDRVYKRLNLFKIVFYVC